MVAIAASFGAPFWFDLLNNIVNLDLRFSYIRDVEDFQYAGTAAVAGTTTVLVVAKYSMKRDVASSE